MRVSTTQIYRQVTESLRRPLYDLYRLNEQIASGKRINKPSDDVTGAARALDYKVMIENGDQYLGAINNSINILAYSDAALTAADTALARMKELTVGAANGATGESSMMAYAAEARELRDQLLSLANTKVGNAYIFSGFRTDAPAFDSSYAYQGDSGLINVNVGGGMQVTQNVTGDETFGYTLGAVKTVGIEDGVFVDYIPGGGSLTIVEIRDSGGTVLDTFSFSSAMELADIIANSMDSNDKRRIYAGMGALDDMMDHINNVRATIGTRMNRLDSQEVRISNLKYVTEVNLSTVEDADLITTASKFAEANIVLSAVQASAAKILSRSLLDFLA